MARLKAEKRGFDYREHTLFRLHQQYHRPDPSRHETHRQGLPADAVYLLVSGNARQELLLAKQGPARKALSEKQFGSRKARADRIRLIRDAQLETLLTRLRHPETGARPAPCARDRSASLDWSPLYRA
jgi:hypothetical protein